ncbi:MAG: exo-alpha-sialidase [Phycisphaeraceae bacterium]|nr:exo-alpha-sialidase [Phycisphaeraceae bacterium]
MNRRRVIGVLVILSTFLAAMSPLSLAADEQPLMQSMDLFEAGQNGYATYRAPTFALTPAGTLLVVAEGRKDGFTDWVDINTIMRRSTDGGRTWSDPAVVIDDGLNTVHNNTLVVDNQTGTLHLMHAINYARVYWRSSDDDGVRWSAPHEITDTFQTFRTRDGYEWTVVAPGMSNGIVLEQGPHKGRYVVPVWLATSHSHRPSISATVFSDDRGQTWQAGQIIARNDDITPNPSETVLMELSDGRVMAHIRNENMQYRRAVSFSNDGATDWTTPVLDEQLFDPICMAGLARYDYHTLIFSNPDSSADPQQILKWKARLRQNLTIRQSVDDGRTWRVSRVLDSGRAGYSQLLVGSDGTIYCFYERGNIYEDVTKFAPRYLSLVQFNLAWLRQGNP